MEINVPKWLKKLASGCGSPMYLVGGFVRNALCALPPSDVDIAGPAMPDELVLPRGFYFATTYKRMGTALIRHRWIEGAQAEYTPFRREKYAPGGGHTPEEVTFGAALEEDALRRDFTANSIYYDIAEERIIDPLGGAEDAARRVLRAYDPDKVFSSDGLRLMRLARIAAETGFDIEEKTAETAKACAPLLADITPGRKRDELMKILMADIKYGVSGAHYRGLTLLRGLGLLKYIIPELDALDGLAQPAKYHRYDALEHTFKVVEYSPPSPTVRLAALLHDVGKAECVRRTGNMHGHDVVGAEMAAEIMGERGMKFPSREIDRVTRLVRWHMYDKERRTRDGKMLLFAARNHDILSDLSSLMKADGLGKGTGEEPAPDRLEEFARRLADSGAPLKVSDLRISGADLRGIGYEGSGIKKKLEELFAACVLDPALNKHKKLMKLAKKE